MTGDRADRTAAALGAGWPIVVVRAGAVLVTAQVLAQAALAGGFVSGQIRWLDLHSLNGILLFVSSGLLVAATVLLFRPGRGPWWPIAFTTSVWLLIAGQATAGFAKLIGLHIPLGVAVMGLISSFTVWACAHRAHR